MNGLYGLIQRCRTGYRNLRLQTKLTITHLVITAIPLAVLFLFFSGKLYNMLVADTIRTEQAVSARTTPTIQKIVDQVADAHSRLTETPFYRALANEGLHPWEDISPGDFRRQAQSLIDGELITGVRIYVDLPSSHQLFSNPGTAPFFRPMDAARGSYWFGIYVGSRAYNSLYCPSFYLSPNEIESEGDLAYITKSAIPFAGEYRTCFTAVYYSKAPFTQLLSDNLTGAGSVAYLLNDRNSLVATSDEGLAGIYHFDYETVRDSFMSSNNFILKNVLGEGVYTGFYSISKAEWFMVVVTPSQPIIAKSAGIMLGFLLICLACIVTAFIIANRLSHSITNRLSTVIAQMAGVRSGPPVALPPSESQDEIGNLIDTYNYMTQVMNQLMEEQAKAAEDLRIAEFNSLQAQINPHFLYNTMDMINWLAQQGRTREVSQAVQDLSRFYKLTLSRKEKITTIAEEIEHVSIYVRLQNMRYNDAIDFVVDVPDHLMEYHIPKLTFQPVVENSILHGLLEKDEKGGAIVLTGWLEEGCVVLLISDDGVGILPEKLPGILSGKGGGGKGTNIAVYNTHRRLQLLYGMDYGLTYRSTPGSGTEVEIRLPAKTGETAEAQPRTPAAKTYLPLVTVAGKREMGMDTVSPLTLLRYNRKLTSDTYEIHDLHQISDKLAKGENLYILSHMVTEDFPAHTHDYFEINYVCQGAVVDVVDGKSLYLTAGDMVILNPQAVQSLRYRQPDTMLLNFCLFRPLFAGTLRVIYEDDTPLGQVLRGTRDSNFIFYPLGHSVKAQSMITAILQEYAGAQFHQTVKLEGMFLLLLADLASSPAYSFIGMDEETINALEYIRANCLTERAAQMAARLGRTEEDLREWLRARLGRELDDVIRDTRLGHALRLLAQPKMNIYQIAESCGYREPGRFFEEFKRQYGVTPEEYRRDML